MAGHTPAPAMFWLRVIAKINRAIIASTDTVPNLKKRKKKKKLKIFYYVNTEEKKGRKCTGRERTDADTAKSWSLSIV